MESTSTEITLLSKIFANSSTEETVQELETGKHQDKEDIDHFEDQNNLENLETLLNLQNLDDSNDLEDLEDLDDLEDLEDLEDLPIRLDTLPIIILRQIFKVLSGIFLFIPFISSVS